MERYVSGVKEKRKVNQHVWSMWEENKLYYIISIYSLPYYWAMNQIVFQLLFKVKHVQLIGFFSWLIGLLAGKISTLINSKPNRKVNFLTNHKYYFGFEQ